MEAVRSGPPRPRSSLSPPPALLLASVSSLGFDSCLVVKKAGRGGFVLLSSGNRAGGKGRTTHHGSRDHSGPSSIILPLYDVLVLDLAAPREVHKQRQATKSTAVTPPHPGVPRWWHIRATARSLRWRRWRGPRRWWGAPCARSLRSGSWRERWRFGTARTEKLFYSAW